MLTISILVLPFNTRCAVYTALLRFPLPLRPKAQCAYIRLCGGHLPAPHLLKWHFPNSASEPQGIADIFRWVIAHFRCTTPKCLPEYLENSLKDKIFGAHCNNFWILEILGMSTRIYYSENFTFSRYWTIAKRKAELSRTIPALFISPFHFDFSDLQILLICFPLRYQ